MTTIIFSGGTPPHPGITSVLPADRHVIAADSGMDHALALGIEVDLLVGDLDSVRPESIALAKKVERHPWDKDVTDLELALLAALDRGEPTLVVAGGGGRLDHLAAEFAVLASPRWAALDLQIWMGPNMLLPVHSGQCRAVDGAYGATVTLLAVLGPATGVTTTGLRWALDDATLLPDSTRGVSNVLTEPLATIEVKEGVVVVVVPDVWT
ncbi:MAG: thiamine diphosphokinase [Acidimicrobiales bacterium]